MEQIISTAIELVVLIIAFVIGKYAIPFVKSLVSAEQLEVAAKWAVTFVKAAESLVSGDKKGSEKLDTVTKWLTEKLNSLGIKMSDSDIRALIEKAVYTMNYEAK